MFRIARNFIQRILDIFSWAHRIDKKIVCEICETEKIKIEFCESRKNAYDYIDDMTNNILFTASKRGPNYGRTVFEQLKFGKNPKMKKIQFDVYSGIEQVDSVLYDEITHKALVLFKPRGCLELIANTMPQEKLFSIARHFENRRIF